MIDNRLNRSKGKMLEQGRSLFDKVFAGSEVVRERKRSGDLFSSQPAKKQKNISGADGATAYSILAQNLLRAIEDRGAKDQVIGVTSCHRGEGVTTVSYNLALALATQEQGSVLLVDANFRHPEAHSLVGCSRQPGLGDLLSGDREDQAVLIQPTGTPLLSFLPAGASDKASRQRFRAQVLEDLFSSFKQHYRFIILDLPEVHGGNEAIEAGSMADGIVLVVETERIRWEVAQAALKRLGEAEVNLLGVALNKRKFHVPHWLYKTL